MKYRGRGFDIFSQLKLEEFLFIRCGPQLKESFAILNYGSVQPYIAMGSSNTSEELLNVNNILNDNMPVIRRFSGGGTVFVDHSTFFFSLISSADLLGISTPSEMVGPRELMTWTDVNLFSPIFCDGLGLNFQLREYVDYCLENKKFAGNAQKISRLKFIHHTSFLWDFDIENIDKYLKIPATINQPKYREHRAHSEFIIKLKEYFNDGDDISAFEDKLIEQLNKHFDVHIENMSDFVQNMIEIEGDKYLDYKFKTMLLQLSYDE